LDESEYPWEREALGYLLRATARDRALPCVVISANRNAKEFKGLLHRQKALRRHRIPYVEPVVFLSGRSLRCELGKAARTGVYLSRETERARSVDIVTVFAGRPPPDQGGPGVDVQRIDRTFSKAMSSIRRGSNPRSGGGVSRTMHPIA
jgi:hypothetical protein